MHFIITLTYNANFPPPFMLPELYRNYKSYKPITLGDLCRQNTVMHTAQVSLNSRESPWLDINLPEPVKGPNLHESFQLHQHLPEIDKITTNCPEMNNNAENEICILGLIHYAS